MSGKPCEATCPKCGSADVWRTYRAKGLKWDLKRWVECKHKYFHEAGWEAYASSEHIHHHCRTCQYEWQTSPMRKP